MEDNAQECRERLFRLFDSRYTERFKKKCKDKCRKVAEFLLKKNIINGDATNYCIPGTTKPIIFSEWTPIGKKIQRKDYVFESLAKGSYQTTLFDENDNPQSFDNFIKEYKPVDFLKLGEDE